MSKDFFVQMADRRADAIAQLDEQTFAPLIRNHLVQLFRMAHEKDKGLTGVVSGAGWGIFATGEFSGILNGEKRTEKAREWGNQFETSPEVRAFLSAVSEYDITDGLPLIQEITPADLETTRSKKAAIHRPRGLRAKMRD